MTISPQEAAEALKDITRTERRSGASLGYQMAWPHLVIWGVIWAIGYGAMALGVTWDWLWAVLSLTGTVTSFVTGYVMARSRTKSFDGRYLASFFAIFAFITALFAILPPTSDIQFGAFFPILVALYYALIGIWTRGLRMLVLGVLLAAGTLAAFLHAREHFMPIMAFVGGGGLILGGLWLRRA
ncbi:MAG TPA: hypothetical protein VGF56_15855 [Rhizomicrobium sp.]|jgi:hypothetical protein